MAGKGISKLSDAEFLSLEKRALKLDNTSLLGQYEQAVVERYFPEISRNGAPLYVIASAADITDTQVDAAIQKAYTDNPGYSPLAIFNRLTRPDDIRSAKGNDLGRDFGQSVISKGLGGKVKKLSTIFSNGKQQAYFTTTAINPAACTSCSDQIKHFDCKSVIDPIRKRSEGLERFFVSEHETSHTISAFLGRDYAIDPKMGPQTSGEESHADAYASLRIISKFGKEGVAFLHQRLSTIINMHDKIVTEHKPTANFFATYSYLGQYSSLLEKYGKHPELLSDKSPRDLYDLAEKEMRPIAPQAVAQISDILFTGKIPENSHSLHPHTQKYIDMRTGQGREKIQTITPEWREGLQVNPDISKTYRLPKKVGPMNSITADLNDPTTLIEMAKFDAAVTAGKCEAPFADRLEQQTGNKKAAALVRQVLKH